MRPAAIMKSRSKINPNAHLAPGHPDPPSDALARGKGPVLEWVVEQLSSTNSSSSSRSSDDSEFPGIDARPGVSGGEPCIIRTRIPFWVLEHARRQGASDQDLLDAYPTLRPADLVNAWAFARTHSTEIEAQIRNNEAAA